MKTRTTKSIMLDLNNQVRYLNMTHFDFQNTSKEKNIMNDLVYYRQKNTQPVTNSRIVAKYFHKTHYSVMRTIKQAADRASQYKDTSKMFMKSALTKDNQSFPVYLMSKDGFMLTVMSFTGAKAMKWKMKFIDAFDYMYEHQSAPKFKLPQTYSAALRQLANKVDENHRLAQKKKQMTPTYHYGQALSVGVKSSFTMKQAADQISNCFTGSIGRNKLLAALRYLGILCHGKSTWNQPRDYYLKHRWFVMKYSRYNKSDLGNSTLVTPKGIKGIIESIRYFISSKDKAKNTRRD